MTNYEKIQNMSIEELADILDHMAVAICVLII